jgi:CheY-like chemotaxis protein
VEFRTPGQNSFAICRRASQAFRMLQPLAIVFFERLMPGSQLVNRLQDLHYRVLVLNEADRLVATVQREAPLLLFVDLATPGDICGTIAKLKSTPDTAHVPVIGFAPDDAPGLLGPAQSAGAILTVSETAVISHLNQLIDQALHVE